MMDEKRTIVRIAMFIKGLINDGYIIKDKFIEQFADSTGQTISESTFKRTKSDVSEYFDIPLKYDKKSKKYTIDKDKKKKQAKDDFFDLYEHSYKALISDHELLFFYCFVKSMIKSEIYFPPQDSSGIQTDYNNILKIIEKLIPPEKRKFTEKIEYKMSEHYKVNNKLRFINLINSIVESLEREKIIEFSYNKNERRLRVEPVKLLHYTGKWYLVGYNTLSKQLRMYNISQITSNVKITHDDFTKESYGENINDYNNSFGIIMSEEVETAVIRFYDSVKNAMKEILWFKDQKTTSGTDKKRGDYTQFELPYPMASSDELIGRVLRYGQYAEIISPAELREKWKETIRTMHKMI